MKITDEDIDKLKQIAKEVRKSIIEEVYDAKSGHPGGALSCTDILVSLYFSQMNINPEKPDDENRDRLILSKGHACAALYATLAHRGYFEKELLKTFRKLGSKLQGHPDKNKLPGIDMSSGSLGQGLSISNGMAMSSKLDGRGFRVYCIVGDGEIQEGQFWEAAMTSSHYKLDNLCVIIDKNKLQIDGRTTEVMNIDPLDKKMESFGFEVLEIDGNNIDEIIAAIQKSKTIKNKPTAIIANTIKGKGVSFMEDLVQWHGKAPNEEEYEKAIKELI